MDRDNIIVPTDNLEELEKDYQEWLMLPMKFKLLSNSECNNKYGCNVEELYHRLKNKILRGDETNNDIEDEDNNLVIESTTESIVNLFKSDDYDECLKKSNELQMSPYIVIIDPGDSRETVIAKYNSFNMLSNKQRDLSNYYSCMLWGYNVYNMYTVLMSYLDTKDIVPDANNIVIETNSVRNYEECIIESYDYLNKAVLEGDILSVYKFIQTSKTDGIKDYISEAVIKNNLGFLYENKVSELVFPKVVPWLTSSQMNMYTNTCSIKPNMNYFKAMNEAYNKYLNDPSYDNACNLIHLGWNPSVPFNSETIEKALCRQIDEASNMNCYNITKISDYNGEGLETISYKDINIRPIYFVFYEDKVAITFSDDYKLSPSLNILYQFDSTVDGSFCGFKKVTREDIRYIGDIDIRIVSIFVDIKAYDILHDIIISGARYENTDKFNSIYNVLLKARNTSDPDRMKVVYSYYIDILLKLIAINPETNEIEDARYIDSRYKTIFLLYSGKYNEYSPIIIDNIMRVICNEANLSKYLSDNEFELDKELITKLTPEAVINMVI